MKTNTVFFFEPRATHIGFYYDNTQYFLYDLNTKKAFCLFRTNRFEQPLSQVEAVIDAYQEELYHTGSVASQKIPAHIADSLLYEATGVTFTT